MANYEGTRTPYGAYDPYGEANLNYPPYREANLNNPPYGVANVNNPPYGEANLNNPPYGEANVNNPPYREANIPYGEANNPPESGFDRGEFSPAAVVPDSKKKRSRSGPMKEYRDIQGNLCTRGGRLRCFGRICCCSLMTTVFLIVSIVLALALFIRPPSIIIGSAVPLSGSVGNAITATSSGISIQLGVDISVANPNYFNVDLQKIEVDLFLSN